MIGAFLHHRNRQQIYRKGIRLNSELGGLAIRQYIAEISYDSGVAEVALSEFGTIPFSGAVSVFASLMDTSRQTYIRAANIDYEAEKIIISISDWDNTLPTDDIWTSILLLGPCAS